MSTFEINFENDIFGQRRTGRNKQWVILRPEAVYKGPFSVKKIKQYCSEMAKVCRVENSISSFTIRYCNR
jgi:hypothetical protein